MRVYVALIFGFFKSIGRITHSDMLFAVMDLFGWLIKVKWISNRHVYNIYTWKIGNPFSLDSVGCTPRVVQV